MPLKQPARRRPTPRPPGGYNAGMERALHRIFAKFKGLEGRLDEAFELLDHIHEHLKAQKRQGEHMAQELDDLIVQVQKNTDTEQSAIVLIQGIADQLAAAGQDPVKLKALRDSLSTSADALAAAILANTPATPTP